MRITKIRITNFRSITEIALDLTEFNVFVGKNNHGKTNVMEAVEWFYNGKGDLSKIRHMQSEDLEVTVEMEFCGVQAGIQSVKSDATREKFRKFADGKDVVRVRRTSLDPKRRQLWQEEEGKWSATNFAGFDNSFNDCLPRLEYVSTRTRLDDVYQYGKKTPIGLMLSGVLTKILESSKQYKELQAKFSEVFSDDESDVRAELSDLSGKVKVHLQKQFPECTEVSFDVSIPAFDELLKNFNTSINDGVVTTAEEKGDGLQRALMLAIIQTYADFRRQHEELGKCFVFMIDEAELHLHPTAQRQLKQALLSLAKSGDQVIINTHSSVLVADDHEIQTLFQVNKIGCVTDITRLPPEGKQNVIYELLGGSPADLLLPRNFLIVEGRADYEFLSKVMKRHFPIIQGIQILWASGDTVQIERSMFAVHQAYIPLYGSPIYRDKVCILVDKPNADQQAAFNHFTHSYPEVTSGERLFVLSAESLEESYPAPWRRTKDEVRSMQDGDKINLARQSGNCITFEQLKAGMPQVIGVIEASWERAYKK